MTIGGPGGFNDLCGPAPAALVFGRGRPVEVHQVALIELELLSCQPGLGRKSAFKSQLSGLCDHRPNGDLPNPEVMSGVARNTARRVIELSLAGGLELSEAWRVAAVQRPIGRVSGNCEEAVLGEEALGQDYVLRDWNAFLR